MNSPLMKKIFDECKSSLIISILTILSRKHIKYEELSLKPQVKQVELNVKNYKTALIKSELL